MRDAVQPDKCPPQNPEVAGETMSRPRRLPTILLQIQKIHTTGQHLKSKTGAEHRWLERHFRDPFVKRAKERNYRCEVPSNCWRLMTNIASFGLAFMSWTAGRPLVPGLRWLLKESMPQDLTQSSLLALSSELIFFICSLWKEQFFSLMLISLIRAPKKEIQTLLPKGKADIILSDMAPNATGIREFDHLKLIHLCLSLLDLARGILRPGGTLLCKFWDGKETHLLRRRLLQDFQEVKTLKPPASRKESAETFFLAKTYRSVSNVQQNKLE